MKRKEYHVVARNDGWVVKRAEGERAMRRFDEKRKAVEAGQLIASRQQATLVVHNRSGKVERIVEQGVTPEGDPEAGLKLKPEIEARLERFQRGEYKSRPLKDALKDLGLDE